MIFENRTRFHRYTVIVLAVTSCVGLAWLIGSFVVGMFTNPTFRPTSSQARTANSLRGKAIEMEQAKAMDSVPAPTASSPSRDELRKAFHFLPMLRTAFLAVEDAGSLADYAKHTADLDAVFPVSLFVSGKDGKIEHRKTATGMEVVFAKKTLFCQTIPNY